MVDKKNEKFHDMLKSVVQSDVNSFAKRFDGIIRDKISEKLDTLTDGVNINLGGSKQEPNSK
jgi:hypothetical protein